MLQSVSKGVREQDDIVRNSLVSGEALLSIFEMFVGWKLEAQQVIALTGSQQNAALLVDTNNSISGKNMEKHRKKGRNSVLGGKQRGIEEGLWPPTLETCPDFAGQTSVHALGCFLYSQQKRPYTELHTSLYTEDTFTVLKQPKQPQKSVQVITTILHQVLPRNFINMRGHSPALQHPH